MQKSNTHKATKCQPTLRDLLQLGADGWNAYRLQHPEFGADIVSDPDEEYEQWSKRMQNTIRIDFIEEDLSGFDFSRYNLGNASFAGADCQGVRFVDAALQGAFFHQSNLSGATFHRAKFDATGFFGCQMRGVRFIACSGAVVFGSVQQLDGMRIQESAIEFVGSSKQDQSRSAGTIPTVTIVYGIPQESAGRCDALKFRTRVTNTGERR